jgi:hypothetical protein
MLRRLRELAAEARAEIQQHRGSDRRLAHRTAADFELLFTVPQAFSTQDSIATLLRGVETLAALRARRRSRPRGRPFQRRIDPKLAAETARRYRSVAKAAAALGCSRWTISRALREESARIAIRLRAPPVERDPV